MSHCTNLVENYCFSRVSDDTLGTFWARFWRCSVLQGHCVSPSGRVRFQPREEEQQQQQEQQEGSMSHCTNLVENYCFSRVSDDTLGTFWARFWRRSVLQGHCVSPSGRVRFQPREEEQQQQQEQQEGSMSHCTNLVENYCFSRVLDDTLGTFWARFWRRSVLQGHCVSPSGRVRFQPREEEQQQQQEQQEGSMSHCTNLVENYCFSRVSDDTLGTFWARFWRRSVLQGHCVSPSGRVRFQPREEEQQQQQEQQEGSMSHCTNSGIKTGRKLLFF